MDKLIKWWKGLTTTKKVIYGIFLCAPMIIFGVIYVLGYAGSLFKTKPTVNSPAHDIANGQANPKKTDVIQNNKASQDISKKLKNISDDLK